MSKSSREVRHAGKRLSLPVSVAGGLATATLAVLTLTTACEGSGGESGEADVLLSQSIPESMLQDGGIRSQPPAQEVALEDLGFTFGDPEAPVQVIEFSDFGCGYCRHFHTETFSTIKSDFIDKGVVHWQYVPYVSGMFPNSLTATFVAECAGAQQEGRRENQLFGQTSRLFYQRQRDWLDMGSGNAYATLQGIAVEAGAQRDELEACVRDQIPRPRIRSGMVSASKLGVRGTPSFLINGKPLVGAQPIEFWSDVITAILAEDSGDGQVPGARP